MAAETSGHFLLNIPSYKLPLTSSHRVFSSLKHWWPTRANEPMKKFLHSFRKHLSSSCMSWEGVEQWAKPSSCLHRANISVEKTNKKQIHKMSSMISTRGRGIENARFGAMIPYTLGRAEQASLRRYRDLEVVRVWATGYRKEWTQAGSRVGSGVRSERWQRAKLTVYCMEFGFHSEWEEKPLQGFRQSDIWPILAVGSFWTWHWEW